MPFCNFNYFCNLTGKIPGAIPVELLSLGDVVFSGLVIIPGEEAASLHDRFVDLGGKTQGLKKLEEIFPCKAEKIK